MYSTQPANFSPPGQIPLTKEQIKAQEARTRKRLNDEFAALKESMATLTKAGHTMPLDLAAMEKAFSKNIAKSGAKLHELADQFAGFKRATQQRINEITLRDRKQKLLHVINLDTAVSRLPVVNYLSEAAADEKAEEGMVFYFSRHLTHTQTHINAYQQARNQLERDRQAIIQSIENANDEVTFENLENAVERYKISADTTQQALFTQYIHYFKMKLQLIQLWQATEPSAVASLFTGLSNTRAQFIRDELACHTDGHYFNKNRSPALFNPLAPRPTYKRGFITERSKKAAHKFFMQLIIALQPRLRQMNARKYSA